MDDLTKSSYKFLLILYKEYLSRLKSDIPKSRAKVFESARYINDSLCQSLSLDDVHQAIYELKRNDLLSFAAYDNTAYNVTLSNSAIAMLEQRFKNGLLSVTDFIAKFIP